MASAQEIYQDMVLAYNAGAKYVVIFNWPTYPETNPYGILSEDHFETMQQFWNYIETKPRENNGVVSGEVVLVLPKDYGWGMRRSEYIKEDTIWGLWPEDEKAILILENVTKLLNQYGLNLDIIYDDARFECKAIYSKAYSWNSTIP